MEWNTEKMRRGRGPFLGTVTDAHFPCPCYPPQKGAQGNMAKDKLHIFVSPDEFEIGGKTKAFNGFYPDSDNFRTKTGIFFKCVENSGKKITKPDDLIDFKAYWEYYDINFGGAKEDGTEFIASRVLLPVESVDHKSLIPAEELAKEEITISPSPWQKKSDNDAPPEVTGEAAPKMSAMKPRASPTPIAKPTADIDWTPIDSKLKADGLSLGAMKRICNRNSISEADLDAHLKELDGAKKLAVDGDTYFIE